MNIKDAKEEIRRTLRAYTAPEGYRIPRVRQRPILLIGPPGIGKTSNRWQRNVRRASSLTQ